MIGEMRPWWHVGCRVLGNPFSSLGMDWCPLCKQEVDTDTEATHRGTTYVFVRTCRRCHHHIKWGRWDNVRLFNAPPLDARLEWITRPEQDRARQR